jgi:antitoxin (DNA-binding transcriptional repressor) of toxin-antitoxin stability system
MTEADLARDFRNVLDRVQSGAEIVIERNAMPVAIIKPVPERVRTMSEIIAAMEAGGAYGIVDEDFARDVEDGIAATGEPWIPPSWD